MLLQKNNYNCINKFVLRTHINPLNKTLVLFNHSNTSTEVLKEIFKNPIINEAIFLASPDLHEQLVKWVNNKITNEKTIERLIISLTKYLLRMGSRCTPFGIFAGFSMGDLNSSTKIELENPEKYKAHLRLDMNYLCALAMDLTKHPNIKNQIKYFPNSSLYTSGNYYRYVEYKYLNSNREHFIVGVEKTYYLTAIIEAAKNGATISSLANLLVDNEITYEEANEYINELIDNQVLISDLEPSVTGSEFLNQIIEKLEPINNISTIKKQLNTIKLNLSQLNQTAIGKNINQYNQISTNIENLGTSFNPKFLFQSDLVLKTKQANISNSIIDDIKTGLDILNRITPTNENKNLKWFKKAFYERYEEREIPLAQALDSECGVGYAQNSNNVSLNPLVDDLILPEKSEEISTFELTPFQKTLFNKLTNAKTKNKIDLIESDFTDLNSNWNHLPPTISTMVEVYKNNGLENPFQVFMQSAGGSSAANLLGRFCHADIHMHKHVKTIIEKEQENNTDFIYAEIVHLPESRTGNVLLRPQMHKYEIPYLAKSSLPIEQQMPIHDIFVSVPNGSKVVLRSKSLNKKIIPRLNTAHNFSNNALPIYRFLCDMQTQGLRSGIGFTWGDLSKQFNFLPRVCYKNIILSKATWNFSKPDIDHLLKIKNIHQKFTPWKNNNNLPDLVALVDGDNELLLNLNNTLCIKTLLSLVKNRQSFQLIEFLFNKENAIVKNHENYHTNQMVFSFYKDT